MKYIHSFLAIWHHQLKVNRKFNMNFNLNMKYDNVRVKQKHLILISQCHWSPTASHPPLLYPQPLAHPHLYDFCPHRLWKFLKSWKKRVIIYIANTCFLRSVRKIASPHRSTGALYLTVNKKLRHSYSQFDLRVVSKKLEHDITYKILTNKIFLNQLQNLGHKSPFQNVKRAKKLVSKLCLSTFPAFQTKCKQIFWVNALNHLGQTAEKGMMWPWCDYLKMYFTELIHLKYKLILWMKTVVFHV